jgi:predicted PurR-regulated permease PerM
MAPRSSSTTLNIRRESLRMADARQDLARTTLSVLFIAALLGASLWILLPFLPATIWAATLVIATWPLMCRMQERLWNSRALAVTFMILTLLLVFVVPFWLAIDTIVENSNQIASWAGAVASVDLPSLPSWLVDLPHVGPKVVRVWERVENAGVHDWLQKAEPYAGALTQWFISAVGSVGVVFLQFLLTVAIAAIMYAKGELAAAAIIRLGARLAGSRGEQAVRLAAQAVRGVALGVVVTALIQSATGGVGLAIAGVPYASVLCAVMFMLCIAQIGPAPILAPAVIWMFMGDDFAGAIFLLVVSILAIGMDNVLRPILIRKGADLPLLMIFAGVIGGLMAFGLIGIFLGPTILAIGYTLLGAWVAEGEGSVVRDPVQPPPEVDRTLIPTASVPTAIPQGPL